MENVIHVPALRNVLTALENVPKALNYVITALDDVITALDDVITALDNVIPALGNVIAVVLMSCNYSVLPHHSCLCIPVQIHQKVVQLTQLLHNMRTTRRREKRSGSMT